MLYILIALALLLCYRIAYRKGSHFGVRYGARRVAERYYLVSRNPPPAPPPPPKSPETLIDFAESAEEYAAKCRRQAAEQVEHPAP